VPAAHSSAGVVLRRWRAVRPRRGARFVVTYSDQIGMQVNRHYPVRLGVEPVESRRIIFSSHQSCRSGTGSAVHC
jgi:hypothetical protein